jgi:acyl-CoA thioester hydrolase
MRAMPDAPARFPLSVRIPVAWGEMDAFQHVNNMVYARWLEAARIVYFERLGLLQRVREAGVGPILARSVIDFRRPVAYPDTVRVDASVSRIGTSSFTMSFRVWSEAQDAEVAAGEQVIVHFDYRASSATPLDAALRAAIAEVEGAPR